MSDFKSETLMADGIGEQTTLGILRKPTGLSPVGSGNCFSLIVYGDRSFKITNMYVENLEFLIGNYIDWPVKIKTVDEYHAEIVDERISSQWFRKDRCQVCCGSIKETK